MDTSRVYLRALALGCFNSLISTRTFRRALTGSVDSCAEIKSTTSVHGVTESGRVWRKVPESDARSVMAPLEMFFLFLSDVIQLFFRIAPCLLIACRSAASSVSSWSVLYLTDLKIMTMTIISWATLISSEFFFYVMTDLKGESTGSFERALRLTKSSWRPAVLAMYWLTNYAVSVLCEFLIDCTIFFLDFFQRKRHFQTVLFACRP